MAIDRKARKPILNGLRLRFVRFSGRALTQGVVNGRTDGAPVFEFTTLPRSLAIASTSTQTWN